MAKRGMVGARELKARLGKYLRRVRSGETLVVTDRGEPAAELRPIPRGRSMEEAALGRLEALGVVTRKGARLVPSFRPIRSSGRSIAEAVTQDRADRF